MNKHTPGPWDLQKPMFGEQHIYVHSENLVSVNGKISSGRQHICVLPYEGKKGGAAYHEMFSANARLIAAAPELLEALKDIAQTIKWHCFGECRGISEGQILSPTEAVEKALAAIKKAGGES